MRSPIAAPLLALLGALVPLVACSDAPRPAAATPADEAPTGASMEIRGVTLDARRPPPDSVLPALARLGATHVALIPFAFMREAAVPALGFNPEVDWYSESATGARALARQADTLGLSLVIKPQVWIAHGRGPEDWSATIAFEAEADWAAWEADYRAFLLHHARLAEEIGADILVIGTELGAAVRARPDAWRAMIAEVREAFSGRLTYAANWHDDAEHVAFWDALDFIGVQAYYPLAGEDSPDMEALRAGWAGPKARLRALHERWGRPVLFTELGYRSVPYAAARPWQWPERGEDAEPDPALQARLYRATAEAWAAEPWFAGVLLWKWYGHVPDGPRHALDFSPQGKPAEAVLRDWFNEP